MSDTQLQIDMMTKVRLDISTAGHPKAPFTFIYGISTDGLTPFERSLFGKTAGDRLTVEISSDTGYEIFAHLTRVLGESRYFSASHEIDITIVAVSQATDREIIAAMAGGSCCSCDCGCSLH
ncbi:hypothetical protein LJC71_08060 [Desulfosarcina sp. OttesenSCG-928-A07]|nr:hypothetical protein [Desulfosarcina sp. OttesenSCG-928-A07]